MRQNETVTVNRYYKTYVQSIQSALENLVVTDHSGRPVGQEEAIMLWCQWTEEVQRLGRVIFFAGNGASATMASHMAADFSKNCDCKAMAFNDIALMTAVSNDISYEQCFSHPLNRFASYGDMLVVISSSGNSPNILRALEMARMMELRRVTLSGMGKTNASRTMGDLNFYIPAETYGLVEASHQSLLHCWLDTYIIIHELLQSQSLIDYSNYNLR